MYHRVNSDKIQVAFEAPVPSSKAIEQQYRKRMGDATEYCYYEIRGWPHRRSSPLTPLVCFAARARR